MKDKGINIEFHRIRDEIVGIERNRYGIGTLAEKTLHNVLKNYYSGSEDYQEVPINEFVADIYKDGQIIEIQTGNFNKMRRKLDSFLPEYKVKIIYPISYIKNLIYIDKETGALSDKRKSPKKENYYTAFKELYKIKQYLNHPNLSIKLVLLSVDQYKFYTGGRKKRGTTNKYDIIPNEIIEELDLTRIEDYIQLIPMELEDRFTAKDFAKIVKVHSSYASLMLNILHYIGVVDRIDKIGNSYVYEVK